MKLKQVPTSGTTTSRHVRLFFVSTFISFNNHLGREIESEIVRERLR